MALEYLSYGWVIIIIGAAFLALEAFSPGFFLLVPGTVLVIIGVLILLGIDIFSSGIGIIIGIGVALIAAAATVLMYSRLGSSDKKPFTTSRDTVTGKEGRVTSEVNEETLAGKVIIDGQIWSASSKQGIIPEGVKVKVISSEGVHIVVEEVM